MRRGMDPRFAGISGLGGFRKSYTGSSFHRLLAVGLAAVMLLPLAFHLARGEAANAGGTADILFSLLGAPLVFWLMWRRRGDAVMLYDEGIACARSGELAVLKWRDICTVREAQVIVSFHEEPTRSMVCLSLETADGGEVNMGWLVDIEQLWEAIGQHVSDCRLRQKLREIRIGRSLSFGPFRVNHGGLVFAANGKERSVDWARIRAVREERGRDPTERKLNVLMESPSSHAVETLARVERYEIPNFHLFLALCTHLAGLEQRRNGRGDGRSARRAPRLRGGSHGRRDRD